MRVGTVTAVFGADIFDVVEDRFRFCIKRSARLERLADGCRWTEGPAYFAAGRYLVWSDIPNDRMLRWDETTGERRRLPRAGGLHQRQHGRPPGPAGELRARRAAGHPHRARRLDHRHRRPPRGQAPQQPERRGRQVRRLDLVHRSRLRHRQRLRGPPGRQRDRRVPRLPRRRRRRELPDRRRRLRPPERPRLLPRRASPVHLRHRRQPRRRRAAPHSRVRRRRRRRRCPAATCSPPGPTAPSTASASTRGPDLDERRRGGRSATSPTARCLARSSCPRSWRTSCSAVRSATACSSARRHRCTRCCYPSTASADGGAVRTASPPRDPGLPASAVM